MVPPSSSGSYASAYELRQSMSRDPGGFGLHSQHSHHSPSPLGGPQPPAGGVGGVANVLSMGGAPGSANTRSRANTRPGGHYAAQPPVGSDDSIIVADRAKLSLLLGECAGG